jgi:hypothetical protein
MSEPARKVYRRPPTWQIRGADGTLHRPGGDGPDWWAARAPVELDPDPAPPEASTSPPAICSGDCTETTEPA